MGFAFDSQRTFASLLDSQRKVANIGSSPALKSMCDSQNKVANIGRSPALRSAFDSQGTFASLLDSQRKLAGLGRSPALRSLLDSQRQYAGLGRSSALRSVFDSQRKLAGLGRSLALRSLLDSQRQYASLGRSSALRSVLDSQGKLAGLGRSPVLKAILDSHSRIRARSRPLSREWQAGLRRSVIRAYETSAEFVDANWAELRTEHPDHPQPVLFVVATFSMSVGAPLYEAAKLREDDGELLDVLDEVLVESGFIEEVQKAVQRSTLPSIPKRYLTTGLQWLSGSQYVDAYPPFYNGLEPALRRAAERNNVVDASGRLIRTGKQVTKIDDVFADLLVDDAQFRRFLSAWIFGVRGNPFRHGSVEDPAECRRQALRLAVAIIGWLELFEGWEESGFRRRLETAAEARLLRAQGEAS
jgi:hypothetical protein